MSTKRYYPTDVTEAQWALLFPLLPPRKWRPGAAAVRPATRHQWDFVPPQDGLPVAHGASGIRQLEHDLRLFQALAACGGMGQTDGSAAALGAPASGPPA